MANSNLQAAKAAKNDEFYTQYNDIAEELKHYTKHFEGKTVLCNCDDPEWSKFWTYFESKFHDLKLKKLISTHYNADGTPSYKLEWCGEEKDGEPVNLIKTALNGNGDFRSEECVELLKEADIVVTNPPFSDQLPTTLVKLCLEHNKKFLIIGNKNMITYKEFFPLLKDNKVWMGYTSPSNFSLPDGSITTKLAGLTRWFTNLEHDKRHKKIILLQDYDIADYPKYDNYEAINVDKVSEVPDYYYGVMGVPITFLDKYCPDQFDILGIANSARWIGHECFTIIKGKKIYNRILIKRKMED